MGTLLCGNITGLLTDRVWVVWREGKVEGDREGGGGGGLKKKRTKNNRKEKHIRLSS